MAARTTFARKRTHARSTLTDSRGVLLSASKLRQTRARLAMLGVPLAITAGLMVGQSWTVIPLSVCAWWWAPRYTGWEWVVALGRGLVGAAWASLVSSALVNFPAHMLAGAGLCLLSAGALVGGPYALRQWVFRAEGRRGKRHSDGVQMRLNRVPSVRKRFAMHLTIQRLPATRKRPD
jgi:hypothetical protein